MVPPMSAPDAVRHNPSLADEQGFLAVDTGTLQHLRYPNVFGVGDSLSVPTARTAAAVGENAAP